MGICAEELRTFVIRPTLEHLGHRSDAAEELLLATAARESGLGFHLTDSHRQRHTQRQVLTRRQGLGIFRIRPFTHRKIWDQFLINHPNLASTVRGLASQHEFLTNPHGELATNLRYAAAIAWLIYYRNFKALPEASDIEGLAKFWKRHYQKHPDPSKDEFIRHYHEYIIGRHEATAA
ncbi:hypothetical protein [Pseudomaricurvus sp.]|uniref:hypothetical protein n=1 Tax=Pseudomaricurvus sp. TaxID=2004510 RepID=UPI003F6BDB5A